MHTLKIIVAGSRDFTNYPFLKQKLDFYCQRYSPSQIEIVSGAARGADRLGEKYAQDRNLSLKKFPADWNKYGRGAGYRRNEQMAEYATHAVVFWDGKSKGSQHMIQIAQEQNLNLRVVHF
ncbi:MAG: DUF2493 domain-containing protein [Xenococcaceae cyanobacterium MO_188.B29]|nr:DUF2493 domain-containing protein [Xenococcaceae cyanobacterium MO_188.B29]